MRRLAELPGVTVTGAVPDVRPYYRESAVCVAPLRIARGIQNKVLQSMALGVPVVATGAAARGLEARADEHFLVEDDPARFAQAVIGLLRDREGRARLAERARAFVEAHHSWSTALARIESVVVDAAGRRSTEAAARPEMGGAARLEAPRQ